MSNLFVHIYCDKYRAQHLCSRYWRSIPAKVRHRPRHAMKVEILFDGEPLKDCKEPQFIIACNDLPAFCRSLLCQKQYFSGASPFLKLRLFIRDEVGIHGSRTNEDEVTESRDFTEDDTAARDPSITGVFPRRNNKSDTMSPRVHRLLESFRRLHSIRDPQIVGPISKTYKAEIIAEMSKPLPRNQHLFAHMLTIFRSAMNNFGSIDYASSVPELKNTLNELREAWKPDIEDTMIVKGPYAGFTIGEAYKSMQFALETRLAWASVKTGDIHTAQIWRTEILPLYLGSSDWEEWEKVAPRGYKIGMVFYLQSQLIQGCNHNHRMGCCADGAGHARFYYLDDAIQALKRGLQYEPANRLLREELQKLERELSEEEEEGVEGLTKMAESLHLISMS